METLDKIAEWFYNNVEHNYTAYNHNEDFILTWASMVSIALVVLAVIALILWGIYSYMDEKLGTNTVVQGILIDKHYRGAEHHSGTGVGMASNGGVALVSTSSSSAEEFLLFIRADKVYKVRCDMQQFYYYQIGDRIMITTRIGKYSNRELKTRLIVKT